MDAKVILVTGCSSGFGFETAQELCRRGHKVFATMRAPHGRNRGPAAALEEAGAEVRELDVTWDESVERAVAGLPALDAVVNNAGVSYLGASEAFTVAQFREALDVNVLGAFRVDRAVLPGMRARGKGLLVHVSSIFGRISMPFFGVYNATKYAVEALAETLDCELAPLGIRSVLVEPGPYPTDIMARLQQPDDRARSDAYATVADRLAPMFEGINAMVAGPDAPQPAEVATAIAELVESEAPPLRTVVGIDFGVRALNEAAAPHERAMRDRFGI